MSELDHLYRTARWGRIRKQRLLAHPLCKFCLDRGLVEPATLVDHIVPHQGDVNRFWLGPFQSLCKNCHDVSKREIEMYGFRCDVGLDGQPLDPNHPWYTGEVPMVIAQRRRQ